MGFSLGKALKSISPLYAISKALRGPKAPTADLGAQLAYDKQNALFNFGLNNNRSNIFGTQQVVPDGNGGYKTVTNYAEPINTAIQGDMNMLPGMQQRIAERLSHKAFDPTDPNARQEIMDAMLSRMNFGADEESLRTRLANQGLTEGSEAWNKEMTQFGQQKNDARMQALLGSGQEMTNLFNLDEAGRMAPINEMNAVSGSMQSLAPDFGQVAYTHDLTNPEKEAYQAKLDAYNSSMATKNQLLGGLFSLGSAAIMGGKK